MKYIPLTNGGFTFVDDDDYEWISKEKWYFVAGYVCAVRRNEKGGLILLHRLIMNTPKGLLTDHKNHYTKDNRKENLRVCFSSENNQNQVTRIFYRGKPKSSKYKGVAWHKREKKWIAYITVEGKWFYLGLRTLETDAAIAYNEAAIIHFGEYACLNVVDKEETVEI